jgi:hypothetical protein
VATTTAMFTDRHRRIKLLCALALLVGLAWRYTSHTTQAPLGYGAALAEPEAYDGALLRLPLWSVDEVLGPERFTMGWMVRGVPVEGSSEGLQPGTTVSVVGRFRASDRTIIADKVQPHPLRPVKAGLSMLTMLMALLLIPRFFGWRQGRVVLRG